MKDPVDLSIGLPDYDAPDAVKQAAIRAINEGKNRYTPSAGLPLLRERIAAEVKAELQAAALLPALPVPLAPRPMPAAKSCGSR